MTDAEISRRLALAIGWPERGMFIRHADSSLMVHFSGGWYRKFDYRDPNVIWPIAERFDAFPWRMVSGWQCQILESAETSFTKENADTAAKAVALAVIKAKEQK